MVGNHQTSIYNFGCLGFQASDVEFLLLDKTTGKKVGKRANLKWISFQMFSEETNILG